MARWANGSVVRCPMFATSDLSTASDLAGPLAAPGRKKKGPCWDSLPMGKWQGVWDEVRHPCRKGLKIAAYLMRRWTRAEIAMLGKERDGEFARKLGRKSQHVTRKRLELGVPATNPRRLWTAETLAWLGNVPDKEIAKRTGRPYQSVSIKRRSLGIGNAAGQVRYWTKAEDALLGKFPDADVAKQLERGLPGVRDRRNRLRIPAFHG